ncbi:MAG: hypothetical protein IKB28_10125 [Clostridia bacterium]|nr:hypothetical protein [Clostridia bacterium]
MIKSSFQACLWFHYTAFFDPWQEKISFFAEIKRMIAKKALQVGGNPFIGIDNAFFLVL